MEAKKLDESLFQLLKNTQIAYAELPVNQTTEMTDLSQTLQFSLWHDNDQLLLCLANAQQTVPIELLQHQFETEPLQAVTTTSLAPYFPEATPKQLSPLLLGAFSYWPIKMIIDIGLDRSALVPLRLLTTPTVLLVTYPDFLLLLNEWQHVPHLINFS